MKKLTTLILLLLSPMVTAQEKEIWACQETEAVGLFWENGEWVKKGVNTANWLLTVDGANSSMKLRGKDFSMECSNHRSASGAYYSCTDGNWTIVLNPATGDAGFSRMLGAINSSPFKDFAGVSVAQCTKF